MKEVVLLFGHRRKNAPVRIAFNANHQDCFPDNAAAAVDVALEHLRAAATIIAAATTADFKIIGDMVARIDQETVDDIAVDLLVTLVDWEDEEREFVQ